ncbi:zinc finger MYND-type containing 8 isoform X2 [Haematobia irritans]|uniref:zinc finger MYND-type containing 8 isoform X2 n=1 Tax=Haematobia irritans TaxID=7368 RepID=UPI003F501BD2
MDVNTLASNDFESMASAVYEAIEEDSPSQRIQFAHLNSQNIDQEKISQYNVISVGNVDEIQPKIKANNSGAIEFNNGKDTTSSSSNLHLEDEISQERFQQHLNPNFERDKRIMPLMVQEDSGLVKKIKISTAKKLAQSFAQSMKAVAPLEEKSPMPQRSSTPLSREFLALQKTQNDSKVIKKFVTDAMMEKTRKVKASKDQSNTNNNLSISSDDHSYTSRQRSSNSTINNSNNTINNPENDYELESSGHMKKRHRKSRFVPLKNNEDDTNLQKRRHRPRSMHDSEQSDLSNSSFSHQMLKKWPSEEFVSKASDGGGGDGVGKRTNMRSENSEFVQKQKEFLKQVINSTQDTPRRRTRSNSVNSNSSFTDTSPSANRERSRNKRFVTDFDPEDADKNMIRDNRTRSRSYSGGANSAVSSSTDHAKQLRKSKSKEGIMSKRLRTDGVEDDDKRSLDCSSTNHEDRDDFNMANTEANSSLDDLDIHIKKMRHPPPKDGSDWFCWKCHEANANMACSKCIRSFHTSCVKAKPDCVWVCPECTTVDNLLNSTKKSRRNELSADLINQLLTHALVRMRVGRGSFSLELPYGKVERYRDLIINPVSFETLDKKIKAKEYRNTEEFVNDVKWMVHNAHILPNKNKLILATKNILKICRQEINEIETCPECYSNANSRKDWFLEVCSHPHLLLWAKLKGFPYWPAKAMNFGQNSSVNVRFFGQHDRAFVSVKDCYLYSLQDPNTQTGKKAARELADCMKEVEQHIEKIKNKIGAFKYAPFKTPYDPADEMKQLEEMMPGVQEFITKHHQQTGAAKPPLQFKIYKTADNNLSIVQKASSTPDLSTPVAQQSSVIHQEEETDMQVSLSKKKKCPSSMEGEKKMDEPVAAMQITPAKYEVVSKVTSDDSNSSKLSTVILKRKSANESQELLLVKKHKADESNDDEFNNDKQKNKSDVAATDKSREKYGKVIDPKYPVVIIKNLSKEKCSAPEDIGDKQASMTEIPNNNDVKTSSVQKVVENLVRTKQGVTIKKVPKESPVATLLSNTSSPQSKGLGDNTMANNVSSNSVEKKTTVVAKNKAEEDQKLTKALKGLVPFVEVKQEVVSDHEEECAKEKETTTTDTNKTLDKEAATTTTNTEQPPEETDRPSSTAATLSSNNSPPKILNPLSNLLTQVKEEIFSDEGESEMHNEKALNQNSTQNNNSAKTLNQTSENPLTSKSGDVRVVGDTTIQKIPNKNIGQQATTNKRIALKGVPYGPLPASAYIQNDCSPGAVTRAKKPFPQNYAITEKIKASSMDNTISSPSLVIASVSQNLDTIKRPMSRNTMVTIPADVAATSRSAESMGTMMSSVPVPPLTAVSKTLPSVNNAHNSMARNAAVTLTVSGTLGSLSSPSVVVGSKTPLVVISSSASMVTSTSSSSSTAMTRNSPLTVVSSTVLPPSSTSMATPPPPPPPSQNHINALCLSNPPPLAGLSGTSLSNSLLNGSGITESISPPNSTNVSVTSPQLNIEAQTQTIAESICRVLPKLAPRPKSLLTLDVQPKFPSQAGPVCSRLFQNSFKVTEVFMSAIEDTIADLAQGDDITSLQSKLTLVNMELERAKLAQEDIRKAAENEKQRLVNETRKQCQNEWKQREQEWKQKEVEWKLREVEWKRLVEETKRKQWCAQCGHEANFYCCWNTSYCDYPCQQLHWSRHASNCAQTRSSSTQDLNIPTSTKQTQNMMQERHHIGKSTPLPSPVNVNAKSSPSVSVTKKEKILGKNVSSSAKTVTPSSSDMLKLPSNTYLRPVNNSSLGNPQLRCNTTYSIPIQRFPPITSTATNPSQTLTILHQGNSWMMSSSGSNAATNSTVAAPVVSVPQMYHHRSGGSGGTGIANTMPTNRSTKTQMRYHLNT